MSSSDEEIRRDIDKFLEKQELKVGDRRDGVVTLYFSHSVARQVLLIIYERGFVTMRWTTTAGKVAPERFKEAITFVTKTNYALTAGMFVLDFDDGEIFYKLSLPVGKLGSKERVLFLVEMYVVSSKIFDNYYTEALELIQEKEKEKDKKKAAGGAELSEGDLVKVCLPHRLNHLPPQTFHSSPPPLFSPLLAPSLRPWKAGSCQDWPKVLG